MILCLGGERRNKFKDYETVFRAIREMEAPKNRTVVVLSMGESEAFERSDGRVVLVGRPVVSDAATMSQYYRAADIFAYATHADNHPLVVLEAMSCGIPVVATAVGGIPEQVRPLNVDDGDRRGFEEIQCFGVDEATGILVPRGDVTAMAHGLDRLASNRELREILGQNAEKHATQKFSSARMADDYLAFYDEVLRG